MQETFQELIMSLFAVDSIWSVVFRGVIWLVVAIIIIASADSASSNDSMGKLKANLGFFLMFIAVSGALVYMLFGFQTG